jgi:hypothetical protein
LTPNGYRSGLGRSPLEVVGTACLLIAAVGTGLLWGVGVLVGSILGSTLTGSGGDGLAAILRSFPDVGQAWRPAIPTGLVWGAAVGLLALLAPLGWRLFHSGDLGDEGSQWATRAHLRRAGLLVSDDPLAHAEAEEVADGA